MKKQYSLDLTGQENKTLKVNTDATGIDFVDVVTSGVWENYNATAAYATYTGIPDGCSTSVTITADNTGTIGNSILLDFNGSETINDGIIEWNSTNLTNTCSLTTGDGTQIPSNKSTLSLTGGVRVGDDTDSASANKAGTTRYRADANNSYCEMCMQTGASTYDWVVIKQNTW